MRTKISCSRRLVSSVGIAVFVTALAGSVHAGDAPAKQDGVKSRAGYSAGYEFGTRLARLKNQAPGFELEAVFSGILDALSGTTPRMSADEMHAALKTWQKGI